MHGKSKESRIRRRNKIEEKPASYENLGEVELVLGMTMLITKGQFGKEICELTEILPVRDIVGVTLWKKSKSVVISLADLVTVDFKKNASRMHKVCPLVEVQSSPQEDRGHQIHEPGRCWNWMDII